MKKNHRGVGAFITTPDRNLFFLQQKDESYPIEKWRLALSVWGGAMESYDFSEEEALIRELKEELNLEEVANIHKHGLFQVESDQIFPITIFEVQYTEEELLALASNSLSTEGRGILVKAPDIWKYEWVWNLDKVLKPIIGEAD